jgi:hypothetical protein
MVERKPEADPYSDGGSMSTEYLEQAAILASFIDAVRATGRACGETLVQKAAYVMKELFEVPFSDEFRIHYYGPFSFQLRDRLASMEADDIIRVSPRDMGVTYDVGERFAQLRQRFPSAIATHVRAIRFAAERLGSLGVKQLEPLATALFVTRELPQAVPSERAAKLMEIKPHVKLAEATAAIEIIDGWIAEVAT